MITESEVCILIPLQLLRLARPAYFVNGNKQYFNTMFWNVHDYLHATFRVPTADSSLVTTIKQGSSKYTL